MPRLSRRHVLPAGVLGGAAAAFPFRFAKVESRSICAENPTGAKGGANRWKERSSVGVPPGQTYTLAGVKGPGMIRHIWLSWANRGPETLREPILRMYWDGQKFPSVEAPLGDFFGLANGRAAHYSSIFLGVSEGRGFNCFFPMPFSSRCRITVENDSAKRLSMLFYQIDYTLGDEVTEEMGRFHAHFRRSRPPRGQNHVLLETKGTPGVYAGAVISALPQEPGSWREGEIRFFIDGDTERPTITGTGWSDYFLSAWGLGIHQSLYAGSNYQVRHPEYGDKYFCSCYRFHVLDPVHFQHDLRVEYQQIGFLPGKKGFQSRADDWCSTVYWYQNLTGQALPPMPAREERMRRLAPPEWEAAALERMRSGQDRIDDMP